MEVNVFVFLLTNRGTIIRLLLRSDELDGLLLLQIMFYFLLNNYIPTRRCIRVTVMLVVYVGGGSG